MAQELLGKYRDILVLYCSLGKVGEKGHERGGALASSHTRLPPRKVRAYSKARIGIPYLGTTESVWRNRVFVMTVFYSLFKARHG